MKANELRIGNFVTAIRCDNSQVIDQVKQLHESYVMTKLNWVKVEPITINEEWLLKFGFEQLTPKYYVLNIDENISFAYYYTYSGGVWHFEFEGIPIKIEYINQLQNIYFALTGNELNIKK